MALLHAVQGSWLALPVQVKRGRKGAGLPGRCCVLERECNAACLKLPGCQCRQCRTTRHFPGLLI